MNTADLKKYHQDTFSLIRTMVIKIEAVALRDNQVLIRSGYPVSSDKSTWRYYMNLNGDYHQTDEVMIIQSIDTGEDIAFTKENLDLHLATRREYNKGGYWFNRLNERYPHQTTLIRGILNPIDYSKTIPAENYKILSYNQNLVLWNEDQLIPKLQSYIKSISRDLFNNDYIITDNLFLPLMIQKLYADMLKAVHTIRLEDIYTRHTHEFFVWSHINSYGNFNRYKSVLTKEQAMWLFRNIAWITKNPGQEYTFNKLMYNLLSVVSIPLAKYDLTGNTEFQIENLTQEPLYRRLQLNLQDYYGYGPKFISTASMIDKEMGLAVSNPEERGNWEEDAFEKGKYSLVSETPTKVLESDMMDYTNKNVHTLMSTVINEWVYLSGTGWFRGNVVVSDPKTGKQRRVDVQDAYNLWRYLIERSKGFDPLYICPAYYDQVMKNKPVQIKEIIDAGGPRYIKEPLAKDIQARWVPISSFYAPEYLIQYSKDVYDVMFDYKRMYSQYYDLNKRARVKSATNAMFTSGIVELGNFKDYDSLIKSMELDFEGYVPEDFKAFAWEVFKQVTGWDSNESPSMSKKQSYLIDLMIQLSSYTIHVIKEMDDGSETSMLINELFVGDSQLVGKGHDLVGYMDNVRLNTESNFDSSHDLVEEIEVLTPDEVKFNATSTGELDLITGDLLEFVDTESDLERYAIKFPSSSYISVLDIPDIPDDREHLGGTHIGKLKPKYSMKGVHIRKLGTGLFPPLELTYTVEPADIGKLKPRRALNEAYLGKVVPRRLDMDDKKIDTSPIIEDPVEENKEDKPFKKFVIPSRRLF